MFKQRVKFSTLIVAYRIRRQRATGRRIVCAIRFFRFVNIGIEISGQNNAARTTTPMIVRCRYSGVGFCITV